MKHSKVKDAPTNSVFFKAAIKGDLTRVKTLLAAGQMIIVRDDNGRTALMRAAEHGHYEIVKALLQAGANVGDTVSDRDSIWFGCNAVIFAAQSGSEEIVETLISAGASPDCEACDETSPLGIAVGHRSVRMVACLLKARAPISDNHLIASVWNGTQAITILLINAGAKANVSNDLGQPALHRAAETGQLQVVQALIQAKAKLNAKANGSTSLLAAIQNRQNPCAIELIKAGADISMVSRLHETPLACAAKLGSADVVAALMKAGANHKAKDRHGRTALMIAHEKGRTGVVQLLQTETQHDQGFKIQEMIESAHTGNAKRVTELLKEGVDANCIHLNGAKPLITATMKGHAEVIRVLIKHGADVNATVTGNMFGLKIKGDALTVACENGSLEIVRLLLQAGADINQSRSFRVDALTLAAGNGHASIVAELIKAGFSTTSGCGLEALEAAVRNKKSEAAVMVVKAGVKFRGKSGANLLVKAIEKKLPEVVKALLAAGVDPKLRDDYDDSPLQVALSAGQKEIAALLQRTQSPQASPNMSLVEAAELGDLKTVHRLILEGVDLEARDAKGATSLMRAAANGQLPVMKALLKAGANPNAATPMVRRDKAKWFHHMDLTSDSPLSCAVAVRCLPAIELLLQAGADIRKTECGHLACMILAEGEPAGAALVSRLIDAGLDPNSTWPIINVSLLEEATNNAFTELAKQLVQRG
ncbi:MAG: ankyrin repeat domain-containing protein, partial [Verrucomicrobiota bacterium]